MDHADVVIVGSGPAGSTYARLICDQVPGARVLMVEAGPVVSQPPGAHVNTITDPGARKQAQIASQGPVQRSYEIAPTGLELLTNRLGDDGPILPHVGLFLLGAAQPGLGPEPGAAWGASPEFPAAAMASNVGGMGAHWFGSSPRPYGSERIGFLDPAVLDEALATGERLLGVSAGQFAGSAMAAKRESMLSAVFDEGRTPDRRVQPMPLAVSRARPGSGQAGPAVILGALEGPKASKASDASDASDASKGGGRGQFELRPETLCRRVLLTGGRATGVDLVDLATGQPYRVAAGQVVVAADSLRTPQLLFASGIRPANLGCHLTEHPYVAALFRADPDPAERDEPGLDEVMPPSGVTWIPFDGLGFPMHVQVHQHADLLSAGLFLTKEVVAENRVEFSDSARDWHGLPSMRVHYSLTDRDRAVVGQAMEVAAAVARACAATALDGWPRLMPAGSSLHYQGTVRMGPADDGDSVCDQHGRVWGTENVFVAGNGLIPTSTACNPTLTGVALAAIGAREVSRQLL